MGKQINRANVLVAGAAIGAYGEQNHRQQKLELGQKRGSAAPLRSIWDFNDRRGKPWKGLIIVEPIGGETGKLMLTIRIARPDSIAAKSIR